MRGRPLHAAAPGNDMRFIETFSLWSYLDSAVSLLAAFLCGTLIGAERQYRQRTAGLRTNALVALGAAAFVDLAVRVAGAVEATRVISYVVSGIGFLGAGVIMKEGMNVRGLNTAATLWCSAAVGACAGADMVAEGVLLTVFVLAGNTALRPLVNAINRIPLDERYAEVNYEVRATVTEERLEETRDRMVALLRRARYQASDVEVEERGGDESEIVATLVNTAVQPRELEGVIAGLRALPGVSHASWGCCTTG
ncbi:MgtC/SapB family protein [Roseomonas sp. NAR14]|uniref:Protein MgtC n=2 Tax=Roseomonas acroporae TaxID=2937791 RepID=A0A9X1Y8D9_9PROT|nr:MgtC/SapB family protein [Roseomonas acroporae]MCK8785418.1 MgtC/SapB family protein [Roseomonas acroporae]